MTREDLPMWEEPRRTTLNSAEGISTWGIFYIEMYGMYAGRR